MFTHRILRLLSVKRPLLGRWCLHDTTKIHWKIDMANIDHCGTCANSSKVDPIKRSPIGVSGGALEGREKAT